jgi:DeoR/GlpR family transcriptional regulator of sugar metabolism
MRYQVKQRMDFITECLEQQGKVNRKDLMDKFGISLPQASIDLQKYKSINPNNMTYNLAKKQYQPINQIQE